MLLEQPARDHRCWALFLWVWACFCEASDLQPSGLEIEAAYTVISIPVLYIACTVIPSLVRQQCACDIRDDILFLFLVLDLLVGFVLHLLPVLG